MWYKTTVLPGLKNGRTIGFPTVNLDPAIIPVTTPTGVYSAVVKYKGKDYKGALYYGPRLVKGGKHVILEIYILDFEKEIYGEGIMFKVGEFIRNIRNFKTMEELKNQITLDIAIIKSTL